MIDLLFVSLFLAAAGDPATAAPADPAAVGQTAPANQQQPTADQTAGQQTGQTDARHQMRCHMERVTGSRLGQRVCMTPAQEDEAREQSRQMVQRMQSGRQSSAGP